MEVRLFHYTSRSLAQEIAISKRLKPGSGGRLYLTREHYQQGHEAAARLSILKTVEMVCCVLNDQVNGLSQEQHVDPIIGQDGDEIRPGCGTEMWTTQEVPLNGNASWILLEPP